MIFIHYITIYLLCNFLWIIFVNAKKIVSIENFQSFEKELKNFEKYEDVELVIKTNITVTHPIEISCNDNVNIHITSSNKDVYINQNFSHLNDTNILKEDIYPNLMINLSNVNEIKIDNITINGNIGIYEAEAVLISSTNFMGDIILNKIKNGFLIQNSHFKPNNKITNNGYIITLKETSKGIISDIIFDADVSTKQVISIHDCYNITIKDSNFNGSLYKLKDIPDFHRVFAIYNSEVIELNNLHIQNFGDKNSKGYIMYISDSKLINIKKCSIHDGYSIEYEMIKVTELSEVIMENIIIYDIYSNIETSIISNEGNLRITGLEFYNNNNFEKLLDKEICYKNDCICNINTLINGNEKSITEVDKSYIHDIKIKFIFIIKNEAKMKIKNTDIEKVDVSSEGAPFSTYKTTKGDYEIDFVNLKHIYQNMIEKYGGLFIFQESPANITVTNSKIENSVTKSEETSVLNIKASQYDLLLLNNVTFTNVETHTYTIISNRGNSDNNRRNRIDFNNVNFVNCSSEEGLIYEFDATPNFKYFNVDGFNKDKKINVILINTGYKENFVSIPFLHSEIKNSKMETFFNFNITANPFKFVNSTLKNNEFSKSAFFVENIRYGALGEITLYNSNFISNIGEKGVIFHKDIQFDNVINIYNNRFENNVARQYGGVFYYNQLNTPDTFINCTFYNNTAPIGSVCYAKSKLHEPKFYPSIFDDKRNLLNKGTKYGEALATNPTKITCNKLENGYLSGDFIKNITCKLIDDYDNIHTLSENFDTLNLDDIIYFEIEASSNTSKHIILNGKTTGYCVGDECSTENIRVIGDAGDYDITFKITYFGNLLKFDGSSYTMNLKIKKCPTKNSNYYESLEDESLKIYSCNLKECTPQCIHGTCLFNNICDCDDGWIGNNCNENLKYKNIAWLSWIFYAFGSLEFILIITLIVLTIFYRKIKEIKIGKPFYLISILLGIILQIIIVFLTYLEPSPIPCILKIWFKYMGNAFIFGSVIVKCYQMANIYNVKKNLKIIRNTIILRYYIIIVIIHVLILVMWTLFDDVHTVKISHTTKGEEFKFCSLPKSSLIGSILSILLIYTCLNNIYESRYIPNDYKEPLGLPVYAYSIYVIIDILITLYINSISSDDNSNSPKNDSLSPDIINTIQCISILIFNPIVAYKLNFKKIYNIIYNEYILDRNEGNSNQYISNTQYNKQSKIVNRDDNQKFAISSIKFLNY